MATGDPAVLQESSQDVKQRDKPLVKSMETPEKATITSNAMKMLDPRWLKPNSIETERIITVLDETIARLELSSLIPRIIESLDRFADVLGPEITKNLIEHQKLSNEMERMLSSSEEEDTMRAEEQRGCLCLLKQRLKCSVRDVLRLLLANPSLCRALKYEALVRESPAEAFIKAFKEFRNFMLERLLTSPTEEEEKIRFLEDISLQIHKNTEAITALQAELAAAIWTREEEIHRKDNVIEDLKSSMQDLTTDCKVTIQNIKEEGEKQREEQLEASQERCARLQQDVQQLEAQLNALVLEHRASELALQKRKCRMETEIVNWIQKYDAHMEEKQAEYEDIHAAYTEEKNQLSLLMEKRAVLLQEYSQIEEERRKQEEKKEQELKELNTLSLAATRIQAFWKGYLVRSLYSSKLKKKKKGKGKGKSKGKGKKTKK
uniref:Dynein regulatory complex protein 10 n=1 Tax=Calidris pygmaea TaxID=425635 RepID=A0A8C3JQP5_9CHAR